MNIMRPRARAAVTDALQSMNPELVIGMIGDDLVIPGDQLAVIVEFVRDRLECRLMADPSQCWTVGKLTDHVLINKREGP